MARVYFHGGRTEARRLIRGVVAALSGREVDRSFVARGVFLTLGFAALTSIQKDFLVKSRGGVGADGVKWPPLSKEYLAYQRRFEKGEKKALKAAAGIGKESRFGVGGNKGILTAEQRKRWKQIFGTRFQRFAASGGEKEAASKAAAIAWATIKAEGAKTMLEVYGNRQVDILRDTGVLFNSLSPGELTGEGGRANYSTPTDKGGEDQVFRLLDNGVVVGTNVAYAAVHQNGNASNPKIPARPFLPREVPDTWLQEWTDAGLDALAAGVAMAVAES